MNNKTFYDRAISTLQFMFNDGTKTPQVGGKNLGEFQSGWIGWNYMALSSIYIHGVNVTYRNSADCIVFGFRYWTPEVATLRAIRSIYVTSPKEHSAADLAKAFPKRAISADLISDELKAARKAHWEAIKERAKKPK